MPNWVKNPYESGVFTLSTLQNDIRWKQRWEEVDEERDYGKDLDWIFIIGMLFTIVIFIMAIVEFCYEIF